MNILLTICARAGSKGVKNKNIRNLAGKPLIAYSIEQAKAWGRAKNIFVSTDSEKIAEIAKKNGAEVPFLRPSELATDEMGKIPVIRHAHKSAEEYYGCVFDIVADLDVSAPIRSVNEIEMCYQTFLTNKPLTLFSVVHAHKNPYFNMVEVGSDHKAHLCKKEYAQTRRRQDAPDVYDINASIYFYARDFLIGEYGDNVVTENSCICEMNPLSSHDIDSELDFKYIEFLIAEKYFPYD